MAGSSWAPAGAGTTVTAPVEEIQLGSSATGPGVTSVRTKGVCSQGEEAVPLSTRGLSMGVASTPPVHPGPGRSTGLPASLLWAWCLGWFPRVPPFPPVVLRWEVRAGVRETQHPSGIQFFSCSNLPWSHRGFSRGGPCLNLLQAMALRIWHAVPMLRPENLLPSFSPGSDTKVLTSPKSCPFSTVLTARLPAVTEAAKRCHFHSDIVRMEEAAKTLQVEVSVREESLVCAREQVDFFLLRKQPHSDSLVCSCEARELACGRSPRQPLERAGKGSRQPVPPCPPSGRQPHRAGH